MTIDRTAWDAQFGSGIRGEYDFTILMAQFTTDARIQDGQQYVLLLSGVDENEEPVEELLTCGANWESLDGGITITNPAKSASINRNTNYGKFCAFAADACIKANADWIFTADAKDARIWVGTKWKMTEKQTGEAFINRQTKEEVAARFRLMPDEYLGRDETATSATVPTAAPAPAPAPSPAIAAASPVAVPAEPSPPTSAPPATTPGAALSIATQLAATSTDYATFINAALAVDAIATDDVLVPQLLDSGPTGFYAVNHTA